MHARLIWQLELDLQQWTCSIGPPAMELFWKQAATAEEKERRLTKREIAGLSLDATVPYPMPIKSQRFFFEEWGNKIFLRLPRLWSMGPIGPIDHNLCNLRNILFPHSSKKIFKT